MSANP
jgi:two-component system OmpR family response regulator